jgi:hypothetical protein
VPFRIFGELMPSRAYNFETAGSSFASGPDSGDFKLVDVSMAQPQAPNLPFQGTLNAPCYPSINSDG